MVPAADNFTEMEREEKAACCRCNSTAIAFAISVDYYVTYEDPGAFLAKVKFASVNKH